VSSLTSARRSLYPFVGVGIVRVRFGVFVVVWAGVVVCGRVSSFVGGRVRFLAGCGGRAVVRGRWRWASCRACHWPRRWVVVVGGCQEVL
jgi:hypothetical protein